MKSISEIRLNPRIEIMELGLDGGNGYINFPYAKRPAVVVFSWGRGWDHVSVSFKGRCPTWEEMCQVKDMFFRDDETVLQFHPAKENYINNHPYCLHLWRPQKEAIPMPEMIMV